MRKSITTRARKSERNTCNKILVDILRSITNSCINHPNWLLGGGFLGLISLSLYLFYLMHMLSQQNAELATLSTKFATGKAELDSLSTKLFATQDQLTSLSTTREIKFTTAPTKLSTTYKLTPTTPSPCEGFYTLPGINLAKDFNLTKDLDEKMWIFLGEKHNERDLTINCLNLLTAHVGKHLVLFEAPSTERKPRCYPDYGIPNRKGRKCNGWDDPVISLEVQKDLREDKRLVNIKRIYDFFEKNNLSDEQLDLVLKEELKTISKKKAELKPQLPAPPQTYENDDVLAYSYPEGTFMGYIRYERVIRDLTAKRPTLSYEKIFEQKASEIPNLKSPIFHTKYLLLQDGTESTKTMDDNKMIQRNKHMVKTLLDSRLGLFTVIIAGGNHVDQDGFGEDGLGSPSARYSQEKVATSGQPAVILTANNRT